MSTAPKKPDGTKPAIKPAGGMLNDRRIRLLLAIIGNLQMYAQPVMLATSGTGLLAVPFKDNYLYLVHIYQQVFGSQRFGYGLALSWVIVVIILWISAITSAFVDNIPFAATMIPVIRAIAAAEGMDIGVLAWSLSLGTDLGGNATPIGASANVVGTSASAKGGYPIGWGRYCKYCVPATLIVMVVSTAYLFLRYL